MTIGFIISAKYPLYLYLPLCLTKTKCFLGVSGGSVYRFLLDTADRIILELNPNMPYVYGQDNIFNINDADAIVMSDKAIPEMAEGELMR